MLYISTSVQALLTQNAGKNMHFKVFNGKKLKKGEKSKKFAAKFCKKQNFKFAPKHKSSVLFPD